VKILNQKISFGISEWSLLLGSLILIPLVLDAAEQWPTRPITAVANVSAGGFTDISTRAFAHEMSKTLGVPIVVVNMPGGGGGIGSKKPF